MRRPLGKGALGHLSFYDHFSPYKKGKPAWNKAKRGKGDQEMKRPAHSFHLSP